MPDDRQELKVTRDKMIDSDIQLKQAITALKELKLQTLPIP